MHVPARPERHDPLDCMTCGACCCNPDENRAEGFADYIEVGPKETLRKHPELMRRLTVMGPDGGVHMRMDREQRCLALKGGLGRKVWCAIYPLRLAGCRRVVEGSARCLQYRRERGIDPA